MPDKDPAFPLPDGKEFRPFGVGYDAPLAFPNPALGLTTIGVDANADDDDGATRMPL